MTGVLGLGLAPGRVRIEMAELLRDPPSRAIQLVPDRSLGFEETLVSVQVPTVELWVEGFRILPNEGNEVLHERVQRLISPRECGPIRHVLQP